MKTDNFKTFCKINQRIKKEHLSFISSNSGTGKTTFFKWLLIRKALKGQKIDFFFRFEGDIEAKFTKEKFLTAPQNASKRLLKLIERVDIFKTGDDYYLINKETNERIGQALAVNTQRKYKSTENELYTQIALFDEIMPDDNTYCPDEVYKFSRLVDSRARYRDYRVIGLYNKTLPFFLYEQSFRKAGAKFIDFVGVKFGQKELDGIQKILSRSNYAEIYNENKFTFYKEFYKEFDTRGFDTLFYVNIQNILFAFKDCNDFYILKRVKKIKKNREVFTLSLQDNDFLLIDKNNQVIQILTTAISQRLLFTNHSNSTIYLKRLADFLYMQYNI